MGGKNYPKKKGSDGSASSPPSSAGSSSAAPPSGRQGPSRQELLKRMGRMAMSSSSGTQSPPKPQQHQQQIPQQEHNEQWGHQSEKRQQCKGDEIPKQGGLPRAESTQSIQSCGSTSTSGGVKPPQNRPPQLTMEDLKKKGIDGLMVKYKGPGKKGRSLGEIETNYLKLAMENLVDSAFHYDVKFEPDRPKKLLTAVFLQFAKNNFPNASLAFDGTNNAYASAVLDIINVPREVIILHPETKRERKFIVSIQAAHDYEIPIKRLLQSYQNPSTNVDKTKRALQAIDVILKSGFHQEHLGDGILGGRSFFLPDQRRNYLGDFYELWLGLFQSTVLGSVPFLNVDVNHKAFPKRYASLVDLLKDMEQDLRMKINPNQPLERNVVTALSRHLSGLEICYQKPSDKPMIYKFMKIVDAPGKVEFELENGQRKTILQYFQETYGSNSIKFVNLSCIKLGNTVKNITIPMELCYIPDSQVINKKCTENQTRNIIRHAATSTDDRKKKIMNLLNQIRHNNSSTIRGFGLEVDPNFIKVQARQLDAPGIQYRNSVVRPNRGVWRNENVQFLLPETATAWSILCTNARTKPFELSEFARMLYQYSVSTGLQLSERPIDIKTISDLRAAKAEMERIGKEKRINILFCIIPDSGPTYAEIKKMAELECGVLTQCIRSLTVLKKRTDQSTISNILLKVNAKLNGTNHRLQSTPILTGQKCMLIGADVTHPSPEQTKIPSVVGVAASFDDNAFRYKFYWRLQGQRKEMIEDFKDIVLEHLKVYKQKNRVLPDKILYYRDGVSEGQFDQVMAIERNAMLIACRQVEQGYEKHVKLTVIVVQKRHHTRFFPGNSGVGRDDRKNNNVPAGTIVDTAITRPNENHFYLVSHQSIQGVAKPTKYCILLDEGNHNIDDIQGLTYNLCHLFTRCNRAVSYPAPTYYAHLVAYRGRCYIENEQLNMNNLKNEWKQRVIKENISDGRPMFFV